MVIMKLYYKHFRQVVNVVGRGIWRDPRYIKGLYYKVKFADGTILETHHSAFSRPWLRKRGSSGKFIKGEKKDPKP